MQLLSSSPEGEILDSSRPLVASRAQVEGQHIIAEHRHDRGQFLYTSAENVEVAVEGVHWSLPMHSAIWIPSNAFHFVRSRAERIAYHSVYVCPDHAAGLPDSAALYTPTKLLAGLVETAADFGSEFKPDSAESRLLRVLGDQLQSLQVDTLTIKLPQHSLLKDLCLQFINNPQIPVTLKEWGHRYGVSERHLARLFHLQMGQRYNQWCQQVRVQYAIVQFQQGKSVTTIATELEYSSASAFCTMFQRIKGVSIRQYMRNHERPR